MIGGPEKEVKGNILNHEDTIKKGQGKTAEGWKNLIRLQDSCDLAAFPGKDDFVLLAAVVCLHEMAHENRQAARNKIFHSL